MIKILLVMAVVYIGYRLLRNAVSGVFSGGGGRGGLKFKCATCKNCKTLFDDGVICAFGKRETFKNEIHIANCHDYERTG